MPVNLNEDEINELKKSFEDLINYDSDEPTDSIDPLTYRAPDGDNCLHIAAFRGDIRSVQLLLKAGLDVNQTGDMGYTALHYAKKKGMKILFKCYYYMVHRKILKMNLASCPYAQSDFSGQ